MADDAPIPAQALGHLALAVPDLDAAVALYRDTFGCQVTEPIELTGQGVRMAYVTLANAGIELMEPLGDSSPIAGFLARNAAGGIHHLCLTTPDAETAARTVAASGPRVLGDGGARPGHHGRKLFFLHPKDTIGALIEIEEAPRQSED